MVFEIPATVSLRRDGKASKFRDKSEDLPLHKIFKAFGKKSKSHLLIPAFRFPQFFENQKPIETDCLFIIAEFK